VLILFIAGVKAESIALTASWCKGTPCNVAIVTGPCFCCEAFDVLMLPLQAQKQKPLQCLQAGEAGLFAAQAMWTGPASA
jgi:hypothetical protein